MTDPYAQETAERWGDTDEYRESRRRTAGYGASEWARQRAESEAIESELADCMVAGAAPGGARARAAAERHRLHIDTWFYPCTHAMHVALADLYVADPRFAAHYDERAPGLASYVREAIIANAGDQGQ